MQIESGKFDQMLELVYLPVSPQSTGPDRKYASIVRTHLIHIVSLYGI